jgi:multidrug efflux pump
MIVNLYSPRDAKNDLYLSNYATIQLRDELARLDGVGDIQFLGQRDYSMRVWVNPSKMANRGVTAEEVSRAINQQNTQVAAGQIGQPPVPTGQAFQYTINTRGRLVEPAEFEAIVLKADADGRLVRLKDVTDKVELGAASFDQTCTLDGRPSVALSIYQLPGSNAIETARRVKTKMAELQSRFPTGVSYEIVYDTTPFIEESVSEVFNTLRDAVLLVALVMLVFLQSWRSAVIPLAAVPVAIVGTFGAMALVGFSLNTLTLFGLVLAVGIVVDDAIVVVEAVEYHLARGLSPKDATAKAMREVAGPVIAVGLVLSAVFVPCVFITGIIGEFFRQFAITIGISTLLSAFNSLTLSPALCGLLLKQHQHGEHRAEPLPRLLIPLALAGVSYLYLRPMIVPWLQPTFGEWAALAASATAIGLSVILGVLIARSVNRLLSYIFDLFNRGFDHFTTWYVWVVQRSLQLTVLVLPAFAALLAATLVLLQSTPTGFIPTQDKGYLLVNIQLTDSASLSRTELVTAQVEELAKALPGVNHTVGIAGYSALLGGNAANTATVYVMLKRFEDRHGPESSSGAIAMRLSALCDTQVLSATVTVFQAPPIDGLGATGGYRMMLSDRLNTDETGLLLQSMTERIVERAATSQELVDVYSGYRVDTPWLEIGFNRDAAESFGVTTADVQRSVQQLFGSEYVNDFNRFGRTWQVTVQADQSYRSKLEDLLKLQVPNRSTGELVPVKNFFTLKDSFGPAMILRHNLHWSAPVAMAPAPGTSSGQALARLDAIVQEELPLGYKSDWTELALLQLETGNTAVWAFGLSVFLVFLVLAAQYESWSLPLAVILVVPLCLLFAAIGVRLAGEDINVFTQIGFVVLVGLASKNAILIVEFARARRAAGMTIVAATLEACRVRLRPIMMTSIAFILGVLPLVLAEGAGAEMRRTLGLAVFAGMLGVTMFGVVLTPVFTFVLQWLSERWFSTKLYDDIVPLTRVDDINSTLVDATPPAHGSG